MGSSFWVLCSCFGLLRWAREMVGKVRRESSLTLCCKSSNSCGENLSRFDLAKASYFADSLLSIPLTSGFDTRNLESFALIPTLPQIILSEIDLLWTIDGKTTALSHRAHKNFPRHKRFDLPNFVLISRSVFCINHQGWYRHQNGIFVTLLTKLACSCSSRTVDYLA